MRTGGATAAVVPSRAPERTVRLEGLGPRAGSRAGPRPRTPPPGPPAGAGRRDSLRVPDAALRSARSFAALLVVLAAAASVADEVAPGAGTAARPRGPEMVALRFAWPAPLLAEVRFSRTRSRPGARPSTFTARWTSSAVREGDGLLVSAARTRWEGDLPVPPAAAASMIRASEAVVQRIGADGEFLGLEGAEALRPAFARVFEELWVPGEQAERAVALAEAGARADAEELWNLAVGFWTGAELELTELYGMERESELPFAPGVRVRSAVEYRIRRRVPCAVGEREARCVEVTLLSTPERPAVERAAKVLLGRLAGPDGAVPAVADLQVDAELVLVTEPATLRPHRLVWTRSLRAGSAEKGPLLEAVDRSAWDWRYPAPAAPKRTPPRKKRPAPGGPAQPPAATVSLPAG
jgi:hypothetical protein